MKTDKKSLEIIKLDSEIMDCFESDEELAVISGGKGIIETIVDFIKDLIGGNENCDCPNYGC